MPAPSCLRVGCARGQKALTRDCTLQMICIGGRSTVTACNPTRDMYFQMLDMRQPFESQLGGKAKTLFTAHFVRGSALGTSQRIWTVQCRGCGAEKSRRRPRRSGGDEKRNMTRSSLNTGRLSTLAVARAQRRRQQQQTTRKDLPNKVKSTWRCSRRALELNWRATHSSARNLTSRMA